MTAVFPGSFDPPTLGHLNLIERASRLFDGLIVVVAENRQKHSLFTAAERTGMIERLVADLPNVEVAVCDRLIVDFMKERGLKVLLRGVRGVDDFSYEFDLSMMNKAVGPQIETVFMTTDPAYFVLRSSALKELASFHGDLSGMAPPCVVAALEEKFGPPPGAPTAR